LYDSILGQITDYIKFCEINILAPYSKVILILEQEECNFQRDSFFESTFGSTIWSIEDRNSIVKTFLEMCENLGEYNLLLKVAKAFKARFREDGAKSSTKNGPGSTLTSIPKSI